MTTSGDSSFRYASFGMTSVFDESVGGKVGDLLSKSPTFPPLITLTTVIPNEVRDLQGFSLYSKTY
jgi:hypothetical protein